MSYYFEKQVGSKCAIHSLNHIFQQALVGDRTYLQNAKYNIYEIDKKLTLAEDQLLTEKNVEFTRERKHVENRSGNYSLMSILHILKMEALQVKYLTATHLYRNVCAVLKHTRLVCLLLHNKRHYTIVKHHNIGQGNNWYHWNSCEDSPKLINEHSQIIRSMQQCILVFPSHIRTQVQHLLT
jgi:hypothetical protein